MPFGEGSGDYCLARHSLLFPASVRLSWAVPWSHGFIGALEGAAVVGGLSAVGAAFYGIGIPKDSILKYESSLKSNKFLVVAHGTTSEVDRARDILVGAGCDDTEVHRGRHQ